MTELEFFPYHNRHIVFRLKNGSEMSGVLMDMMKDGESKKPRTVYTYVSTNNMRKWKWLERMGRPEQMKELEGEVDINDIEWAMRLNY